MTTTETTALTTSEQQELQRHETVIARGLGTFVEVGNALTAIRDAQLYREKYETFDAYCRQRWEIGRSQAYRLIDASAVVSNVSPIGDTVPENEAQARPLASLPPEEQRTIWKEAVDTSPGGKPTAAHVQQIVNAHKPEKAQPPADDAPHLPPDFAPAQARAKKIGIFISMSASGHFSFTYESTRAVAGAAGTWTQALYLLTALEQKAATPPPAQTTLPGVVPDQEIAAAPAAPVLTPLPAAAPPLLTPLTPVAPAASDDQALIQKAAMLLYCRKLVALAQRDWDDLARPHLDAGNTPIVQLDEAQAEVAARLALSGPAMRAQAGMLTFGAQITMERWGEETSDADEEIVA